MSSNKKGGCLFYFLAPFVIIGIVLLGYSFYLTYKSLITHRWVKVKADVVFADILYSYSSDETTSKVIAKYSYEMNRVKFTNDDITVNDSYNNFEDHSLVLETLKNAQSINIYVNPDQPSESVIIKGMTSNSIFILLMAVFWNGILFVFILPFILISNKEGNSIFN